MLKFASSEIPEKKKSAIGVSGIKLGKNDTVNGVYLYEDGIEAKVTVNNKQVVLNKLKMSKRGAPGSKQR